MPSGRDRSPSHKVDHHLIKTRSRKPEIVSRLHFNILDPGFYKVNSSQHWQKYFWI
jgi:hypothetical protein